MINCTDLFKIYKEKINNQNKISIYFKTNQFNIKSKYNNKEAEQIGFKVKKIRLSNEKECYR